MSYYLEQSKCSCCHRCRMECPVGAITMRDSKYYIQPDVCISCGSCVKVCHNGCISDPEAPVEIKRHETVYKTCEVCVVGAGGAGLVAAAKAADEGLKVILLEKAHEAGGCAWYAGGFITHYSKWHREAGVPYDPEKMFKEVMEKTENQIDPLLLRRMFEANVQFLDWLISEHDLGADYSLVLTPRGYNIGTQLVWPNAHKRIDKMIGPGEIGSYLTERLLADFLSKGGEILYKTEGREILTDSTGAAVGIIASDAGGDIQISCKSLVLSTGAFTHNREIMAKMQPLFYDDEGKEPVHIFTVPTCTGDGITMGEAIGADVDYKNHRVNMFGPMRHPYPCPSLHTAICGSGVKFGSDGRLFIADPELDKVISPLVFEPKRYCWHIVDTPIVEATVQAEIDSPPQTAGMDLGAFMKKWREVFAEEEAGGSIVSADSLEALADRLGFDKEYFVRNIKAYNDSLKKPQAAASSEHPDRPRRPAMPIEKGPFFAIKMKLFHEDAVGGLVIDKNAAVLRNGRPVPGLFASGDTTRGIMVPGDVSVYYLERIFSCLTQAYNEGYISGVEAVKYARG